MFYKLMKCLLMMLIISCTWVTIFSKVTVKKGILFTDDFEKGTVKWDFVNPDKTKIVDSGDPRHDKVLSLHSGGEAVYALIKGSHGWTNIKVEGDVFFPFYYHHYMGLIYNYNVTGTRVDFGSIFLLGPYGDDLQNYYKTYRKLQEHPPDHFLGNIILVNPHRDSNASRLLYPEYWVTLKGDSAVKPGEWHHFKGEIVGPTCHFYVGDMETPQVTYNYFEYSSGRVGFKPRFVGSECRLDNIKVTSIKELSYKGPPLPAGRDYKPGKLLTTWDVIGPFNKRIKEIENNGFVPGKLYDVEKKKYQWEPFKVDGRGCIVSGKIVRRFNGKWFAYFHTGIASDIKKEVTLEFSSSNPLVIRVNNTLAGNIGAMFVTWYDFWENPEHKGAKINVTLKPGENHIIVLVKGGRYGGDGFFAYCRIKE